jgi:NADH-quinone oxidoreductase subunit J
MDFSTVFFWMFSVVLLFSAFRVVTARNPVHAVLFLMLAFSQAAGLWLLLRAEFLAITLVLVYLGAVMVLFLFVVMMLDIRIEGVRQGFWKQVPIAAVIGALVVMQLGTVLMNGFGTFDAPLQPMGDAEIGNTKALGILLYTKYLYPIQVAAAILLVAMLAAIALTLRHRKDSRKMDASLQVRVKAGDRLSMVKMDATRQPEPEVVNEEQKA